MKELPKKWCCLSTPKTRNILNKFINSKGYGSKLGADMYVHFPFLSNGGSCYYEIQNGYTNISFKDFERLVLKVSKNYEIYY